MGEMSPEQLATILTAVFAAIVQLSVARMGRHQTEAHDLRDKVRELEAKLEKAEDDADSWRERFYEEREKRTGKP